MTKENARLIMQYVADGTLDDLGRLPIQSFMWVCSQVSQARRIVEKCNEQADKPRDG